MQLPGVKMDQPTADLWTLTRGQPQIDPFDLFRAIEKELVQENLDYRTQLLIHDSAAALRQHWGPEHFSEYLNRSSFRGRIIAIAEGKFDEIGFPSIVKRLMDKTKAKLVRQFLQHIGESLHKESRIEIAGSVALILSGLISRHTEDIDIVGEIPKELQANHKLLEELQDSYGLHLVHVQSHYFPAGWESRVYHLGRFARLDVYFLDAYDIFLGKLFSSRVKDVGDLRCLIAHLEKSRIKQLLPETCQDFLNSENLRKQAEGNWRIIYGEELPS